MDDKCIIKRKKKGKGKLIGIILKTNARKVKFAKRHKERRDENKIKRSCSCPTLTITGVK